MKKYLKIVLCLAACLCLALSAACLFAGAVINLKKSRDLSAHLASLQA